MISTVLYVTYVICKRLAIFITSATSTGFPKSNLKSIFWYTHAKLLQIPCPQQREIARDMEKKKTEKDILQCECFLWRNAFLCSVWPPLLTHKAEGGWRKKGIFI